MPARNVVHDSNDTNGDNLERVAPTGNDDHDDGAAPSDALPRRCAKTTFVRFASQGFWDYVYLGNFAVATALLPMIVANESSQHRLDDTTLTTVLGLVLFLMGVSPVVPVAGALVIRVFMFRYLKQISTERDARYWNLFFFISIRIMHRYQPRASTEIKKQETDQLATVAEEPRTETNPGTLRNRSPSSSSSSSSSSSTSFVEVEIAENEIAWTCLLCREFNLQEKKINDPNRKRRLLGTVENASRVQMIMRDIGDNLKDQYVAEFRFQRKVNRCWKCDTPYDYEPRNRSLMGKPVFYRATDNDDDDETCQPTTNESSLFSGSNDANHEDEDVDPLKRLNVRTVATTRTLWSVVSSRDGSFINKCRRLPRRLRMFYHEHVVERTDPPPVQPYNEYALYYRNRFSQRYVYEHSPRWRRERLAEGERYEVGTEIECTEERVRGDWYPGRIVSVKQYDKYDVLYDNGEFAECVAGDKIRFRVTLRISLTSRVIMSGVLVIATACPLSISRNVRFRLEEGEDYGSGGGGGFDERRTYFDQALEIVVTTSVVYLVALASTQVRSFFQTPRSGFCLHFRLFLFSSLPSWAMLVTGSALSTKMSLSSSSWLKWWHCTASSVCFHAFASVHLACVDIAWGCLWALTCMPLIAFGIVTSLNADGIVDVESTFVRFAFLQCFALFLILGRLVVPLARGSSF